VQQLFYGFKVVQLSVFLGWCYVHADASLAASPHDVVALGVGGALILIGQTLNLCVFYRLGVVGVFYGDRLGYEVPRCRDFPFSVLAHPQYVGTVLSIWGFFLALRFPHDDWIVLPALETLYYAVGAALEDRRWGHLSAARLASPSERAGRGLHRACGVHDLLVERDHLVTRAVGRPLVFNTGERHERQAPSRRPEQGQSRLGLLDRQHHIHLSGQRAFRPARQRARHPQLNPPPAAEDGHRLADAFPETNDAQRISGG
jgi:methylene-fatty-acyl-phospholipid synthase